MAALTTLSDLLNRATGGNNGTPEKISFFKANRQAGIAGVTVAGQYSDLWTYAGSPSHGVVPTGTAAYPTNATDGSLKQTDPGGGRQKWLVSAYLGAAQAGTFTLYDRLAHVGGLDATVTGINTASALNPGGVGMTRYDTNATCVGNEIWVSISTQIGGTATTITASYKNQANVTQTTTAVAIGGTGLREVNRIIRLPLAAGDTGVQEVISTTLAASTTTAGDFAVMIVRPLVKFPIVSASTGCLRDFVSGHPGPVEVLSGACLALAFRASGTTGPDLDGELNFVEA